MGIISLGIAPNGLSGGLDQHFEPNYKVSLTAITDSAWDDPAAVVNNLYSAYGLGIGRQYDLSRVGLPFSKDPQALCTSINASLEEMLANFDRKWRVDLEFGRWDPFIVENPLDAPILPVIRPVVREYAMTKDYNGKAICDTAGQPYVDIKREVHNFQFTFTKNYATLPDLVQYQGHINNATWQGFDPYTIKFNACSAEQIPSAVLKSTYWKVDFEFEYCGLIAEAGNDNASDAQNTDGTLENPQATGKPIGWLLTTLNAGLFQIQGSTLVPCVVGGQVATQPVPLDTSGAQIANPTEANIIYNTFHVFPESDFNSIFSDFPVDLFAVQAYPSQS